MLFTYDIITRLSNPNEDWDVKKLEEMIHSIIPSAALERDNEGQLEIYTGLNEEAQGKAGTSDSYREAALSLREENG